MNVVKELVKTYLLFFFVCFTGRVLLYILYINRFEEIGLWESLLTFLYGLRMDTIAISFLLVIPVLVLSSAPRRTAAFASKFLRAYVLAGLLVLIFMENATFPFFAEYDVRPNYLFLEYFKYPKEVGSLMFKEYKLELLLSCAMMAIAAWLFLKFKIINFSNAVNLPYRTRILLLLPLLLVLFIGIRSSFGHRPANTSDAYYSNNRILNEITNNSIYSVAYAFYSSRKHGSKSIGRYGKIELSEAYMLAAEILNIDFDDPKRPFYRKVTSHFSSAEPKNLVVFIQESMGAQFVEFSGGSQELTPNMNKLGREYLAFTNLYANGTRSIRGLAALSAGFLAVPGEGVVKRSKSQNDFFTLSSLLEPHGYKSSFIYGGEARFDNMKGWYLGNGFDRVIEQSDFEHPTFISTWGVCDEDLVVKANSLFREHSQKNERFVSVMFSQSNHSPFEIPDNKIEYVEGVPRQSEENAIRYADFAIGRLFELAKNEAYFKDTVFVVVADHNVRVRGDEAVPVDMFHIPAIIVMDDMVPQQYTKLASQPDVLATALDLLGLELSYPILGHSIFSDDKKEIAFMQFNETYALRHKDKVAIIAPDIAPKTYFYENKSLKPTEHDSVLEKSAIAIVTVLEDMYDKKLYR